MAAGVGAESPVALFVDRAPDSLVAFLAVVRAGGATLVLDPVYPAERLRYLLADAAPIILHHQERFDGADGTDGTYPGYPAGIAGDEIPLGSRIIAVVDAYDAMTSDRPYRGAKQAAEALAELRREAGRQFDPLVVEVFAEVLAERPWDG